MKRTLSISICSLLLLSLAGGFFFTRKVGRIKTDTEGVSLHLEGSWWSKITVGPQVKGVEAKKGTYRPCRLYRKLERKVADEKGKSRSLKEPKLRIFDETGKELANGKFAFG